LVWKKPLAVAEYVRLGGGLLEFHKAAHEFESTMRAKPSRFERRGAHADCVTGATVFPAAVRSRAFVLCMSPQFCLLEAKGGGGLPFFIDSA
jgi:hypothetical protein